MLRWDCECLGLLAQRKPGKSQGKSELFPVDYSPAFPGCSASGLAAFSGRARSYKMITAVMVPFLVLFRAKENAPSSLCSFFILANLDLRTRIVSGSPRPRSIEPDGQPTELYQTMAHGKARAFPWAVCFYWLFTAS